MNDTLLCVCLCVCTHLPLMSLSMRLLINRQASYTVQLFWMVCIKYKRLWKNDSDSLLIPLLLFHPLNTISSSYTCMGLREPLERGWPTRATALMKTNSLLLRNHQLSPRSPNIMWNADWFGLVQGPTAAVNSGAQWPHLVKDTFTQVLNLCLIIFLILLQG